jgi:hypothetical protein
MKRNEGWKYALDHETGKPFKSFNAWTKGCPHACRAKIWAAMGTFESLVTDLHPEQIDGISKGNLKILEKLSSDVRKDDKVLEEARNSDVDGFRKFLETSHPAQLIEHKESMKLNPTGSQSAYIQGTIAAMKEYLADYSEDGTPVEIKSKITDEYALEKICSLARSASLGDKPGTLEDFVSDPTTIDGDIQNEPDESEPEYF